MNGMKWMVFALTFYLLKVIVGDGDDVDRNKCGFGMICKHS